MSTGKRYLPGYDVIVVGSGMAGLMAGTRLAKAGKKVLMLEKHNLTGGYATSFVRGRYEFEVSLHEACEFGDGKDGRAVCVSPEIDVKIRPFVEPCSSRFKRGGVGVARVA